MHLDIKSANVLLQDATFAVAKLADLGISKSLDKGDQYSKSWRLGAQSLCQLHSLHCLLGCSQLSTCADLMCHRVWGRACQGCMRSRYSDCEMSCVYRLHPNEEARHVRKALQPPLC